MQFEKKINLIYLPRDVELLLAQPVGHVVVLAAPAPEDVGEAVDEAEVLDGHGGDAAEDVVVGEPVEEGVDGHGEVPRLHRARVQVAVVLGEQVDVVEDEARVVMLPG